MQNKVFKNFLLLFILIGFLVFIVELFWKHIQKKGTDVSGMIVHEHFNPSFLRIRTVTEFVNYCDSLYGNKQIAGSDSEKYASMVSSTLRDRFYHGYSYYGIGDNTLGYLLAMSIKNDLNAIVIPDDILKHPMAACSQQSIIGMEVFKRKGFDVRKVGFKTDNYGGHFCYEAFFDSKWHFFDPDMEPKLSIMIDNHFPSIEAIAKNDSLLHLLYQKKDSSYVENLFPTYQYGKVNKFPAPHAIIYQYITKYLSYGSWIILLIIYYLYTQAVNSKKKRKCVELQGSLAPELRA